MTLEPARLADARRQRGEMLEAVHRADVARADFEHAVRRLHAAGATLREIGAELALSHQRVHQIVDDGSPRPERRRRARARRGPAGPCGFCGRDRALVQMLVAGPGICICERCVEVAVEAGTSGKAVADGGIRLAPLPTDAARSCRFCGKDGSLVTYLVGRGRARICSECLVLCQEIVAEEVGAAPSP